MCGVGYQGRWYWGMVCIPARVSSHKTPAADAADAADAAACCAAPIDQSTHTFQSKRDGLTDQCWIKRLAGSCLLVAAVAAAAAAAVYTRVGLPALLGSIDHSSHGTPPPLDSMSPLAARPCASLVIEGRQWCDDTTVHAPTPPNPWGAGAVCLGSEPRCVSVGAPVVR